LGSDGRRGEKGMKKIESLGELIKTDVLVIGGGLSGLNASIKAKEKSSDVLWWINVG
jgi:heterodisulfide reductase subunit A-like polyferredoxin